MVLNLKEKKTTLNPALIPDSEAYEVNYEVVVLFTWLGCIFQ